MKNQPVYQIVVQGKIDADWSDWFDHMTITPQDDGLAALTGPVADQSALLGILVKIGYMNLTLISVNRIEEETLCS